MDGDNFVDAVYAVIDTAVRSKRQLPVLVRVIFPHGCGPETPVLVTTYKELRAELEKHS